MTDPYDSFNHSLWVARRPEDPFEALHLLVVATVGARLFTVTSVENGGRLARRTYTSDPESYPLSGTKVVEANRWTAIVLDGREVFVANTLAEIAEVFPDHELIGSLGLGSVVNLPLVLGDDIVATINLLDVEGHYSPERVATIRQKLAMPALAAQITHRRLREEAPGSCS